MLDALRRTGWHNYSLFLRDDGLLVGYFETPESFQAALAGMNKEEINNKWQEFMAPYFENLSGAHADESMVELENVPIGIAFMDEIHDYEKRELNKRANQVKPKSKR